MTARRGSGPAADPLHLFHPAVAAWFRETFPEGPTEAQRLAWPAIARGENILLVSPTGTGKTLAAFLVALDAILIEEHGDLLLIRVSGSHFIWKMVRRLVGVLVEVGRGGLTPEQAAGFLEERSPWPARLTAPASGLFLERVAYPGDPPAPPLRPAIEVRSGEQG
ncbi:MAG TPA: DEAD/DEAH box helicase [Vicinamibacterales bacterium]|nr:DEAD/DEAH box helicase [Vicinamibacterales bacterium]